MSHLKLKVFKCGCSHVNSNIPQCDFFEGPLEQFSMRLGPLRNVVQTHLSAAYS